jgi:hypothetical protein
MYSLRVPFFFTTDLLRAMVYNNPELKSARNLRALMAPVWLFKLDGLAAGVISLKEEAGGERSVR